MTADRFWNRFFFLSIFVVACLFIYILRPILTPFLIAAILAYLCNPLVTKLCKGGMKRVHAATIVLTGILIVIVMLILIITPLIGKQIDPLIKLLMTSSEWLQNSLIPWVQTNLGLRLGGQVSDLLNIPGDEWMQTGKKVFQTVLQSGKLLFEVVLNLVLIPVVTFYLLRDFDVLAKNIRDLIPKRSKRTVENLAHECDDVLSAFIRGQLLVMLILSIFYAISLSVLGLNAGVLIGIIVGIINIVPYLGSIAGVLLAIISALVQFGTLSSVLWVVIIFAVGHLFENLFLAPKLIGDRIGVHPVAVIFAILAGGVLFGFFGVLLALPTAAVLTVLLRHWRDWYRSSKYYKI